MISSAHKQIYRAHRTDDSYCASGLCIAESWTPSYSKLQSTIRAESANVSNFPLAQSVEVIQKHSLCAGRIFTYIR